MRKNTSINLDDLATTLSGLTPAQREQLELALTPAEEREISQRRKEVGKLNSQGKLLTIGNLADI